MVFSVLDDILSRLIHVCYISLFIIIVLLINWKLYHKLPIFSKERENYRIPKKIWTYHRGETPTYFEAWCLESWRRLHPDFEICVLTPVTWKGYTRIPNPETDAPLLRDPDRWEEALQLHVLEEHGGVWLDSHVYLRECLEDWLFPRHGECAGFHYTSKDYIFIVSQEKQKPDHHVPLVDRRCLGAEKGNPLLRQWRDEYMRLLSFPSVEAYLKSIYTATSLEQFTFPVDWVMPLALQHVLLKKPYPMESFLLHSSEEGPLKHEMHGRGDKKKAEDIGKQSKERIVFFTKKNSY